MCRDFLIISIAKIYKQEMNNKQKKVLIIKTKSEMFKYQNKGCRIKQIMIKTIIIIWKVNRIKIFNLKGFESTLYIDLKIIINRNRFLTKIWVKIKI